MELLQGYNPFQQTLINKGVESQYIKPRTKGNKTYRYVEVSYIIELLNQLFGYIWTWEVGDPQVRLTGGQDKNGLEKSFVTVKGRLSVPVLDPNSNGGKYIWISKESFGSHLFAGTDPEVQGYAYKAAASDALKKCASMLGVAKNVYMSEEMFEYLQEEGLADDWTDEMIAAYQNQYDQMMNLAATDPDLARKIHEFCVETKDYSEMDHVTPSNVMHFLMWIKDKNVPVEEALDPLEIETQPKAEEKPVQRVLPKLY